MYYPLNTATRCGIETQWITTAKLSQSSDRKHTDLGCIGYSILYTIQCIGYSAYLQYNILYWIRYNIQTHDILRILFYVFCILLYLYHSIVFCILYTTVSIIPWYNIQWRHVTLYFLKLLWPQSFCSGKMCKDMMRLSSFILPTKEIGEERVLEAKWNFPAVSLKFLFLW